MLVDVVVVVVPTHVKPETAVLVDVVVVVVVVLDVEVDEVSVLVMDTAVVVVVRVAVNVSSLKVAETVTALLGIENAQGLLEEPPEQDAPNMVQLENV